MGVSHLTRSIQAIAYSKSTDSEAIFDKLMNTASLNVNPEDSNADFPISQAIFYEDWDRAKRMIDHSTFKAAVADKEGTTYLHSAAGKKGANALSMAEFFIQNGANVNAKNMFGQTPLMDAGFSGSADMVRLLLEKGANPNLRSNNGFTPLDIACAVKSKEVIAVLLPHTKLTMNDLRPESPMLKAMQACPKETQLMFVKKALQTYIETRESEKTTVRNVFSRLVTGHSKDNKLSAAKKLLNQLDHPEHGELNESTLRVLRQGRLGTIFNFCEKNKLGVTEPVVASKATASSIARGPPSAIVDQQKIMEQQKGFKASFAQLRAQGTAAKIPQTEENDENQKRAMPGNTI
jgi:hypothetical protein